MPPLTPVLSTAPEPQSEAERRARFGTGDLWVFAYGSLMWNPGFDPQETVPARVHGYHRDLCVASVRYRGTPECLGIVLGLRQGGSCQGMALRVAAAERQAVAAALDERELITRLYHPRFLSCHLQDGRRVEAYGYVVDPTHGQYLGHLSREEKLVLLRQGVGCNGTSAEYLRNTVACLDRQGITDRRLQGYLAALNRP
ncbi:gamma-glutamylcyclotransferase [Novispirillum itersonii]|uniref:gamma-glutamylcyclotransferase n=1 Tax=Novispirillum itersonii TaxID=189 RepID=UPI000476BEBC|nr:gamma-glutamylcyclotransferase [Novispirillum itersonii]